MKFNISALYKRHIRIVPGVKSYVFASAFVLILGVIITLFSWYVDKQRIETEKDTVLNEQITSIRTDLVNRLSIHEQILKGSTGLIHASDNVTRAEWASYIQQYDLKGAYPGVSGVGYIPYLKESELNNYIQSIRAQGFADFDINPAGQRPDYGPITYVEPDFPPGSKAFGFDVLSEPIRRQAADRATESGKVSVSEKTVLAGTKDIPGFALYSAMYTKGVQPRNAEERKANLVGFVFAAYRADTFFNAAIDKEKLSAYSDVQIFDGQSVEDKALLYQTAGFASHDLGKYSEAYTFNIFDRDWTVRFAGPAEISSTDSQRSNMILIGGITLSFAIAGFLFLIMLTRARAIVYSKQKEAQQAKDDLLSLASHQLRTPATAVKQYLGMILEGYTGEIDQKQLPALQKAYGSNERQLDTINQILYVAKADAGRLSINRSNFDLNLLVDDIASDLTDMVEEKGQSIVIERSKKDLHINADESSLRMVIENLVTNASKYSHNDSDIMIKTGINSKEIYVAISDNGVGIAPGDFEKLFKKFSRIDNDLSLQVGGSGIGLYIDKVLIELHGGRIDVKSKLDEGSTFTVFLPKNIANNLTDGGD